MPSDTVSQAQLASVVCVPQAVRGLTQLTLLLCWHQLVAKPQDVGVGCLWLHLRASLSYMIWV
jgi:hypothetical protein